jgi:predicted Zn-dependent peptidase
MKHSTIKAIAALLLPLSVLWGNDYKHDFTTVPNDPYNVLHYTLENGLQVYLSVNKDEPRVSTNIAVRTGSKNDPAEFTGLAHYLEHMLFKGTSKMGSLNWEKEKPLLQEISNQYELYRQTESETQRKAIYATIDSLSNEASKYVATNEYDQMISALGARGVNAYTSLERTVYISDIPTIELEKWMRIEAERFQELTLRLFHTELEAVFEEFNRTQDSDSRQAYYALMQALFPTHTYGTQNTIGEGEHLKNPSMVAIHQYFNKYYVPNNVAIILVGDLDPDKTIDLIEKHFGSWKKGQTPDQYQNPGQPEIVNPIVREVTGTEAEYSMLSYRVGGIDSEDAMMADLVSSVLSNGEAGLIDQNLNTSQKVLRAYAYSNPLKDYTMLTLGVTPREGQTLDEANALLLEQIDLLKKGKFDEQLLKSIILNEKKSQMRQAEYNNWKASTIIDGFIFDKPWPYFAHYYDEMAKISKGRVVSWANKNLKDNYVLVNKKQGARNPLRLDKPEITAVQINRGQSSKFRKEWEKTPSARAIPQFVDYSKDIIKADAFSNLQVYYVPNKTNQLFELNYIFDMGSRNDKELALAVEYLPYLGTSKLTVDEVKRKFYDLGLDYSVYAGDDRLYVTLSGLNESLLEGTRLFEELLANVQADAESYTKLIDGKLKKRANAKLDKNSILYRGMMNYAIYGQISPQTDILSERELRAINPENLALKIRDLRNFKHKVFYYGPSKQNEILEMVRKEHPVKLELKDYPKRTHYDYVAQRKNTVYYVNYDQVQTELMMLSRGDNFDVSSMAAANVFNQYFGSGLSSIVFQEIRESKALAYSAYAVYTTPTRADEAHFVRAYIGAQADKLGNAVTAMQELMNDMPREQSQFEQALIGAMKQIETNPITKSSIYWSYQSTVDRGLTENPTAAIYKEMKNMKVDDLQLFFDTHIKDKKYTYLVIGKKENLDMDALKKLGNVKELTLEQIFGY